jgi:fatty-acyl-CoA synthase
MTPVDTLLATPVRPNAAVLRDWVRAIGALTHRGKQPDTTLGAVVNAAAAAHPDDPALIGEHTHLTYAMLAAQANRYARWALDEGIAPGDVVALLMPNDPDYVAIWLGLTQVGCVVALLNTHLPPPALAHCITAAAARHLIVTASLLDRVTPLTHAPMQCWVHGGSAFHLPRIDQAVQRMSGETLAPAEQRAPAGPDTALLIYTSGTTGLPKATRVSHARIMEWSDWFAGMMNAGPDDRLYDCLPMYHSVGGVVAVGAMLVAGGAVVIRARFSASRFWDDVVSTHCTIVQYIGELCRYLLQSPPHPLETAHTLRLCCGNGLRADVWQAFQQRFEIPQILEFYAATEGSVSLYNCEGKPGAIGRFPGVLAHRFPVALIRCDVTTGEPIRGDDGFCRRCAPDEPGEAIGQSSNRPFDGYTDDAASARKILRDVFVPGDRWFRTGDLMRKDAAGYFYFHDRLGDTFRWKGENVATAEVAATLGKCPGVREVVVYGVAVPGAEGKAGMAALAVEAGFDLTTFRAHAHASLPSYARPLFVRVIPAIEHTGTFKLMSGNLAREGYRGIDGVWFDSLADAAFVACDADLLQRIDRRAVRL